MKALQGLEHKKYAVEFFKKIKNIETHSSKYFAIINSEEMTFERVTMKSLYEELVKQTYLGHHSEGKWIDYFMVRKGIYIAFTDIWKNCQK